MTEEHKKDEKTNTTPDTHDQKEKKVEEKK